MVRFKTGNMFDDVPQRDTVTLVTTNSFIKRDGSLVMGRGAALEFKSRFSNADRIFGEKVREICGHLGRYGVIIIGGYGIFQAKRHFKDAADLELIRNSIAHLLAYALRRPDKEFHVNYPGIGFGHLKEEDVLPLLHVLPDNVFVWKKPVEIYVRFNGGGQN